MLTVCTSVLAGLGFGLFACCPFFSFNFCRYSLYHYYYKAIACPGLTSCGVSVFFFPFISDGSCLNGIKFDF